MDIAIIGSTGSIGSQTLDVCRRFPEQLRVVGLAGGKNQDLLARQIAEFRPRFVAGASGVAQGVLEDIGAEGLTLEELAAQSAIDRIVMATSGRAGLEPTLAAIRAGTDIVIANKEVLVMAGELVVAAARASGSELFAVDSEHSAIWQCLRGEVDDYKDAHEIDRVLLTASGGAFRDVPVEELASVTPEQALQHPNWVMGPKVTVDSATLMNKGFEVIETHWLFGVPYEKIEIVLHRESLVHSMVEFSDGAIKAQLGPPDMRTPIQYALSYPNRWANDSLPRLDFTKASSLHFDVPDYARYPCLKLALAAASAGGTHTTVLSTADEYAVNRFIEGNAAFTDIPAMVERALEAHVPEAGPASTLEAVLDAERATIRHLESRVPV